MCVIVYMGRFSVMRRLFSILEGVSRASAQLKLYLEVFHYDSFYQ